MFLLYPPGKNSTDALPFCGKILLTRKSVDAIYYKNLNSFHHLREKNILLTAVESNSHLYDKNKRDCKKADLSASKSRVGKSEVEIRHAFALGKQNMEMEIKQCNIGFLMCRKYSAKLKE